MGLSFVCFSQDVHWSQPATALLYINPAFTGTTGKFSANAGYRDQWNAVTSNYKTALLSADYRLGSEKQPLGFNLGGIFYNDVTAGGNFRNNCFGIAASSFMKTGENTYLGAGLGYHFVRSTMFTDRYTWGSQFNGVSIDPALASGEPQTAEFREYANLQAGVAFMYEESAGGVDHTLNRKTTVGYSIDHINRPEASLFGATDKLLMKHSIFLQSFLPASSDRALKPLLFAHLQGPMLEITGGALVRNALGQVSKITGIRKGSGFSYGLYYRFKDALIPVVEFEKENLAIGLSYDINISKLTPASQLRGGVEVSIRLRPVGQPALIKTKPPTTRFPSEGASK